MTEAIRSTSSAAPSPQGGIARLRDFVIDFSTLLDASPSEAQILDQGGALLASLVRHDDWLPDEYAAPHPEYYSQYLLYADASERFSVVSFVWGPGQRTPIHDHATWGLIGMLRGEERSQRFIHDQGRWLPHRHPDHLRPGDIDRLSPSAGDVHQVSNAFDDQVSISIHVYGGNIGAIRRSVFTADGERKPFISGYSNDRIPNLWDRSKERRP
ncbi:cysteine dioxygenase [Halotalea alkalilenta]|uniref:Cysteine dioxygenase n=1 Tax=Halotalea alkalilenta TaxID=376489 RepID=A0A172YGB6_9GAMM|nr:cysteine dioxygenase [Halotalea alkalilenta]ANF58102.1 cysteine dioxygenase [Halotalea alkalilenta]